MIPDGFFLHLAKYSSGSLKSLTTLLVSYIATGLPPSKKLAKEVAPGATEAPANEKQKTTLLPKTGGRYVNISVR